MVSIDEAKRLIKKTLNDDRRYEHSLNVAGKMAVLALFFQEPEELWYLTGLLHDIDLPETIDNLERHGLLAENMLRGLLPPVAVRAVKSHDYRTGISPGSRLAEALVFADMLEIMEHTAGRDRISACRGNRTWDELLRDFPDKEYHVGVIRSFGNENPGIPLP